MFITPSPADKRRVLFFPFVNTEPGTRDGAEEPQQPETWRPANAGLH
jgi:hypothetical protein